MPTVSQGLAASGFERPRPEARARHCFPGTAGTSAYRDADGAILVLVLVVLLLLSTVVLHVTRKAVEVHENHVFLFQSAQAALQSEAARGLAVELLASAGSGPGRDDKMLASNVWEQGELRITFVPVNAKLNLNALRRASEQSPVRQPLERAVALILAEAVPAVPEGSVADILDWVSPEDQREDIFFRSRIPARYDQVAYKPRKGPLERPEELLLVQGFETLDPAWVREHFTIWGEDERVNLNAAPRSILLALAPELEPYWPAVDRHRMERGFGRPDELLTSIRLPMDVYQRVLPRIRLDADVYEAVVEIRLPAWYELHRIILRREPLNEDAPVRILAADVLEARPMTD